MVWTLTTVVFVSKMVKRRLEVIMHESACHRKLERHKHVIFYKTQNEMKQTGFPTTRRRHQFKETNDADCMKKTDNQLSTF